MKKSTFRYILVTFGMVLTLSGCVKEMEIDIQNTERQVAVTCLFHPDDNFELAISEIKLLNEDEDRYVENAVVEISSGAGEIFILDYSGREGKYTLAKKPDAGETYYLKINIPEHEEISAQSTVPDFVKAIVHDFEIKWVKYLYPNNLMDYDVFPLKVDFEKNIKDACFMFRARTFNPREGYKRYMLSSSSLAKLEAEGLPNYVVAELEKMVDRWHVHSWDITNALYLKKDYEMSAIFSPLLQNELKEKTVPNREKEAFHNAVCFGDDSWLNNISYDVHTVIGEGQNIDRAGLLYSDANLKYQMEQGDQWNWEFWLEITRGSNEYIHYYQTYILQVSQRINPYSQPVMVHSNVINATGIFAGYNRQMIHLFTY